MDLLKKELERKKKAVEQAKHSSKVQLQSTSTSSSKKVYLKTANVRKFQQEQLEQEREEREKKRQKELSKVENKKKKKRSVAHGDGRTDDFKDSKDSKRLKRDTTSKNNSTSSSTTTTTATNSINNKDVSKENGEAAELDNDQENQKSKISEMTTEEITKAMRELGIPIWLFGERTNLQRTKRLIEAQESQRAAMVGISEMDEFRLGSGHGIRNTFLKRKNDNDDGLRKSTTATSSSSATTTAIISTTDPKQQEEEEDDEKDPHKTIHRFFKSLLKTWEEELVQRPESIKKTAAGKNETKTLKQCKDYIRPLFKLCKNRRLEENMMGHILKIVQCCKEGEFVKANDSYMDLAIGRAAWPIGVTMVGIHARSGRAKIESSNVAHVMNSELQRKYLTSVKRLMNYCQKIRKDVAPSKKVTNC